MTRKRKFGRLTIIRRLGLDANKHARVLCWCRCGNKTTTTENHLVSGHTVSCGCLRREKSRKLARIMGAKTFKHGQCGTSTYRAWIAMNQRCSNPRNPNYRLYGGQGVTVCDRWNPAKGGSFENFLADIGERKPGMTLGRIFDGNLYSPSTCEWQDQKTQGTHRRLHNWGNRFIKKFTDAGESLKASQKSAA